jgi:hypothetical protein
LTFLNKPAQQKALTFQITNITLLCNFFSTQKNPPQSKALCNTAEQNWTNCFYLTHTGLLHPVSSSRNMIIWLYNEAFLIEKRTSVGVFFMLN